MLKSRTIDLIKSFRLWNAYHPRPRADKADHLRWRRATVGSELVRTMQIQLLALRIENYRTYQREQLADTGY